LKDLGDILSPLFCQPSYLINRFLVITYFVITYFLTLPSKPFFAFSHIGHLPVKGAPLTSQAKLRTRTVHKIVAAESWG